MILKQAEGSKKKKKTAAAMKLKRQKQRKRNEKLVLEKTDRLDKTPPRLTNIKRAIRKY